jgi:DoxX-like family
MKKTKILYWVFTILFAIMMFGSAIPDVFSQPIAIKGMHTDLGYPLYLLPFIGIAKWLGVAAILIPGYSIIASGGNAGQWGFMIMPIALGALSYFYYHKRKSGAESVNFKPVIS